MNSTAGGWREKGRHPPKGEVNVPYQEKQACGQGACNISIRPPPNFSSHLATTCPEVVARLGSLTSVLQRPSGPPRLLQRGKTGTQEPCAAAHSSDISSLSPLPLPLASHCLLRHLEYSSTHYSKQQKALAGVLLEVFAQPQFHHNSTNFTNISNAKQPQFPQPLLRRLLLQTLHQLRCPSLDTLQHLHVPLVVRGPTLNTVFELNVQMFSTDENQALNDDGAALNPFSAQPVLVLGIAPTQVQDLALGLVELHEVCTGPPLKPVKVPLDGIPSLQRVDHTTQLGVVGKLAEDNDIDRVIQNCVKKAKQPQFPQLLLRRLLLQTLHQLCCPSLDTLQHLHVFLVVRGPKLNTVFEVRPHQCRVQGDDRFPSPAGHMISDTSQDAIGLLGHLGTLLAHTQPAVNQHSQVLFHWAAFQPLFPKPVVLHGVAVTQVQDLTLSLVEPHTTGLGPSIQPVQVPLQSLPTLKQINTPAQLGVICKLAEGALDPFIQIIDKDIKQNWPQY
ncbi:hypothetical protein QYF61_008975 [Mycteria americana]|uniref:Uncharacterized protein n=1 Tax=Mycteria americana TaxID=33587 RepID=A0AAN7NTF6_MYCAM|nr:hypothetical protein QYF61_008975 [Mycteria americana]